MQPYLIASLDHVNCSIGSLMSRQVFSLIVGIGLNWGKLTTCSIRILTICIFFLFPNLVFRADFGFRLRQYLINTYLVLFF